MAAPKGQRIAIIIIAIVMVVGTIGSFAAIVLGLQNESADLERSQTQLADYQAELDAQTTKLSDRYYPKFKEYRSAPAAFKAKSIDNLTTKDLRVGTGKTIKDGNDYSAYYIGWNPKGEVFDQSFEGDSLKAPIDPSMGLIEGWNEGVKGMKVGGVRMLTIPAKQAYGEQGGGEDIPPNTPIKFIVYAIEKPEVIEQPNLPASPGGLQGQF